MNAFRRIAAMARADFRERARRSSFWMIVGLAAYLGYTVNAGFWSLNLGDWRGEASAAMIGTMIAMVAGLMFSWVGFFLVRGSIERDRTTRVGQVLAATPMSRPVYTLAKALSNFAVLGSMTLVLALAAAVMVATTARGARFDPWAVIEPFLLLALPITALTAAAAVFFETVPGLGGVFGNITYFMLWGLGLTAGIKSGSPWLDFSGFGIVHDSQLQALLVAVPEAGSPGMSLQLMSERVTATFPWNGIEWTGPLLATRLFWCALAVVIALVAAIPFDRFDTAPRRRTTTTAIATTTERESSRPKSSIAELAPVRSRGRRAMARLLVAELRLLLKGHGWAWYAVTLALAVAQLVNPVEAVRSLLVATWLWPIGVFSALGCRARVHGVDDLLRTAAAPLWRQLPATWLAGWLLGALNAAPAIVTFARAGRFDLVLAVGAAALLVPSLALALGTWSGTPRVFQVTYLFLWYLGPLNRLSNLDYLAVTDEAVRLGIPQFTLLASAGLFAAAIAGRQRQLRR